MRVIGIDPGKLGGISVVSNDSAECWPMPETERDVWDLFGLLSVTPTILDEPEGIRDFINHPTIALIEKVHAMPGQGVTSMFNFGMNYGMLRAFLIAKGYPFGTVTPQKWQKHFGLLRRGTQPYETNTQKKNRHRSLAQELFPSLKITHKVADSLLIARYGFLMQGGFNGQGRQEVASDRGEVLGEGDRP